VRLKTNPANARHNNSEHHIIRDQSQKFEPSSSLLHFSADMMATTTNDASEDLQGCVSTSTARPPAASRSKPMNDVDITSRSSCTDEETKSQLITQEAGERATRQGTVGTKQIVCSDRCGECRTQFRICSRATTESA